MNKVLVILLFLLVGCSKDKSSTPEPTKPVTSNAAQWTLSSIELGDLDFGLVEFNKQKVISVNIFNDGEEAIVGDLILDSTDFTLALSNCENLKPKDKCLAKISFNAKDKDQDTYTANISFGEHINTITAQVNRSNQLKSSAFRSNNVPVDSFNFGTIQHKHNLIKTIQVTNSGTVATKETVVMADSNFQKVYDNCSNRDIKPNNSCLIKVLLTGQGKSGPITSQLSYGDKILALSAVVKPQAQVSQEHSEFIFLYNNQHTSSPIDLKTINLNQAKEFKFYVKNIGSESGLVNDFSLSSAFDIFYNNCQGKMVAPNQSCFLRAYITPQVKGSFSSNLSVDVDYQVNTQPVQWTVRSPGDKIDCTNQIPDALVANITWSGESYSECIVEACSPTHHIVSNTCELNVIACTVMNGSGTQTWNPLTSTYESCQVNSCESNRYQLINNQCDYIEPIAQNNNHALDEDTVLVNQSFNFSSTNPATISIVSNVNHGTLTVVGSSYSYQPNLNFNGVDYFTFKINDGVVDSNIATIVFNVNSINDIPVAIAQSSSTNEDTPVNINLSATDVDLDFLVYEISSAPANGMVSVNGSVATYTPNLNFNGVDSFSYIAKDSTSQSIPVTVVVTVSPINDQPLAQSQTIGIVEDTPRSITLTGSDVESSNLTYTITQPPSSGVLSGTAPNLTYTPTFNFPGTVTMKFKVSDGITDSSEVTVTLTNTVVSKDYLNERINALETKYRAKGHNITLPRIVAEPVTVSHINAISSVINPLNLTDTTSALIGGSTLNSADINTAFAKHSNIRYHCSNISECYANKNSYSRAIYGTSILTVQNNFLWDAANSRYLGTQCNAWYTSGELSWVDKKLDSNKSNLWNGTYADNTTQNRYLTVFNQTAPTCGTIYYSYNQGCRSYGYVYITIDGVQFPSTSMGNGGCANGSGVANVSKGGSVHIGSHYYGSGTLRTGY